MYVELLAATDNKRLLETVFEELARGNTRPFAAAMADGFRWVFPGGWSWAGTWEPKEVVLDGLLRPLMSQFRDYRIEADLILADGDRVVVQAHSVSTTKRGDRYDQTYCYVFRLAGGQLTEVVEYCDTALVERVLDRLVPPG